eukprot:scaffold12816_cov126-Skeletonema_dohrnii-CCMP3373.AAC.7
MNPSSSPSPDYSVNYSSSSSRTDDILLPGQQPTRHDEEDEGVVITPTPTQIVIKTRLVKQKHNPFAASNDQCNDPSTYVPPSLSNISATPQNQETKVFINVCTHSIIALPSQRKTLDENGKQIDGWRLPMSMGDLRPFYDKGGNACIAADCIMNPKIVADMRADPNNHFHFVCDLIIQCAERKFQHSRFGGRALGRSFKLPKMKYAAYVDERTNLSILPKAVEELRGSLEGSIPDVVPPRPVVAKQRVKGSGGKAAIIEEIECTEADSKEPPPQLSQVRIELFVTTEQNKEMVPLFDFLRETADMDASLNEQPLRTLREMIKSPQLKPCEEENLSKSQLLKIPLPLKDCQAKAIIAKCSFQSGLSQSDLPAINVSAFLLTMSKTEMNSATECVLPFAVDTHQISARYETKSGMFELRMPLLQSALDFEQHADPGTRQWEIQNAFRMKSSDNKPKKVCDDDSSGSPYLEDDFGRNDDSNEDKDILPEDAFHSRDIMSRHLLQKQEEMQKSQQQKSVRGREGADTEYIHVDDFKPGGKHHGKKDVRDPMLQQAEKVLKQHIPCQNSGNLAFGLV